MERSIDMKITSQKGETIVEALVSVLIAALCFVALQVSIVSSANINKKSMEENVPFNKDEVSTESITVTIKRNGSSDTTVTGIQGYKTSGGYYYYE